MIYTEKFSEMKYTSFQDNRILLARGEHKGLDFYVLSLGTHPCAYINCKEHDYNKYKINCHGGITYEEKSLRLPEEEIEGNFIGWDYAHSQDYTSFDHRGYQHTTDEMIWECIDVIEQVLRG